MLADLITAPAQVCGTFRLVPLLREPGKVRSDLRLSYRREGESSVVDVGDGTYYTAYIPHAFVVEWPASGAPVVALGTQLGKSRQVSAVPKVFHRMAKREARGEANSLRLLPLHLAMEGLLALHFGGPDMKWDYFSNRVLSKGLSPRIESTYPGWYLEGFEDALRVFEIHQGQVGLMVFVADALASVFVVPHPSDYRKLHETLLRDFYGELIWQYAVAGASLAPAHATIDENKVHSLSDLRAAVQELRNDWATFSKTLAAGLLDVPVNAQKVYQTGQFTLERFISELDPAFENHIGERIVGPDGSLQYLKTFRLSAAQTRRAYLLKRFSECDWHLPTLAEELQTTESELLLRFQKADLGWIFHQHVMDHARAVRRKLLKR